MRSPASVDGDERLRLFAALPLPADAVARLVAWQAKELGGADGARLVPPENLHVTVAFLGARPASDVEGIRRVLGESARTAGPAVLTADRYRETRSVGMVVLDDEDGSAAALADAVAQGLETLGVSTEM